MENEQVVGYIRDQIRAGYSETVLREHLLAHGWSLEAVEDAFARYGGATAPIDITDSPVRHRRRHYRSRASQRAKKRRLKIAAAVVAVVIAAAAVLLLRHGPAIQAPVTIVPLSHGQRQTLDVNTIAGAIGQYTFQHGALPTHLAVGDANNQLVMCGGDVCDPTTSQISTLTVYGAPDVKIEPYSATLTVPDTKTLYLIPHAKCASTTRLGGPNANPRSMIILYAEQKASGSGLQQYCVTL